MNEATEESQRTAMASAVVLTSVFIIAICGLVYELIAGTLSSYLLGDSTTQFSLTIGLFLTSMGVGSFLSRFLKGHLVFWFVTIELLIGVVGGFSALAGFASFAFTDLYVPVLIAHVFVIGALVGLEIPLVIRLLEEVRSLRVTVANVFSVDYAGALVASIVFPFFLLPQLGLVRSSLIVGITNVLVATILLHNLKGQMRGRQKGLTIAVIISLVTLITATAMAGSMVEEFENRVYQDEVIFSSASRYQQVVLTRWRNDTRLYLNGHLQFSSIDEYRYHEALAIPALASAERRGEVLILGGGDGLLARQVLKFEDVRRITLVDLDPMVTDLFSNRRVLRELNGNSLRSEKMRIQNTDAMAFLSETNEVFDVILIDLPDPSESSLSKLYSEAFYRLCLSHLAENGTLATQATSPFRSREAFWCINKTLQAVRTTRGQGISERFYTKPYHAYIPTFGTWGFVMASRRPIDVDNIKISVNTNFLTTETLSSLFHFPKDMERLPTKVNRLNDPVLSQLYRSGYHKYLD